MRVTLRECGCGSDQVATVCKPSNSPAFRARAECANCGAVGQECLDLNQERAHRAAARAWNYQRRQAERVPA